MHDARPSSVRTTPPRPGIRLVRTLVTCLCLTVGEDLWAAQVAGQVTGPDGHPVAGAVVVISGASAVPVTSTTGPDGRFSADVPDGPVDIRAFAPGMDGDLRGIAAGRTDLEVALTLKAVAETLTVTASPIDTPLSLRGDSVSVLTRDDLDRRHMRTLGDALRLVPGLTVARSGGPGMVTSVFPRGGESDFTLVLVDGVRANAFGGGLDLSQVPVGGAARIEVVRGPQSALYGSDAIGGVVQIVTNHGDGTSVDGVVEGGGREARNAALSARAGGRGWTGGVSWSHQQDAGFTGRAPADGATVTNDDSVLDQLGGRAAWRGPAGTEAAATFDYLDSDRGAPGPYGSNPAGNFFGVDRVARSLTWRRSAGLVLTQPVGGAASRVRVRAEADAADFDLEFRSDFGSRGNTTRRHGRLQVDAAATATLGLSAGVDGLAESGRSTYITANGVEAPVRRAAFAGFAEARWQPQARAAFTAGVRVERLTRDALAAEPFAFTPRPAFVADTVVAVNPKVTAAWTLTEPRSPRGASTRLHASVGTGIRPPDAFEIAFTDNDGLAPERSTSVDAGVVQTFAGGAVQLDATAFLNRYDDLIISVGRLSASSRYQTDNIANARARGLETALAWRPSAAVALRGHYTWLDTEVLVVDGGAAQAPPPFTVGDPLLRRPRHQGGVDVTVGTARLQAFATATLRGRALDVEPNFGATGGLFTNDGYGLLTAGGAWTLRRGLSVHARVANLLGAAYEEVFGYPALGRTFYAGLRLAARR